MLLYSSSSLSVQAADVSEGTGTEPRIVFVSSVNNRVTLLDGRWSDYSVSAKHLWVGRDITCTGNTNTVVLVPYRLTLFLIPRCSSSGSPTCSEVEVFTVARGQFLGSCIRYYTLLFLLIILTLIIVALFSNLLCVTWLKEMCSSDRNKKKTRFKY